MKDTPPALLYIKTSKLNIKIKIIGIYLPQFEDLDPLCEIKEEKQHPHFPAIQQD